MDTTRATYLTDVEKEMLNKAIIGYGKLTDAAEKTGLHVNTIRIISYKGYGSPETIEVLREKLLIVENAEDKVATALMNEDAK